MKKLSTQNLAQSTETVTVASVEELKTILENIPWERIANLDELFD